jgi:hypothetical protein
MYHIRLEERLIKMERRIVEDKEETDKRIKTLEETVEYHTKVCGYDRIHDVLDDGMSILLFSFLSYVIDV